MSHVYIPIYLVSCEKLHLIPNSNWSVVICLPKSFYIHAIDAYTFYDSLWSVLFSNILFILVDPYTQVLCLSVFHWILVSGVSGFDFFLMKWYSDPHLQQVFGFWPLHLLRLLLELRILKSGYLYPSPPYMLFKTFISRVRTYTVTAGWLRKNCFLIISYWMFQIQIINL